MWEGEPVGVDPKRPLVAFALVAVLCAVLMTLSVGRGWSTDVFDQGRPIAAPQPAVDGPDQSGDEPAQSAAVVNEVSLPAELSPQPLGIASDAPLAAPAPEPTPSEPGVGRSQVEKQAETLVESTVPQIVTGAPESTRDARKTERKADRAAAKAVRKADRAAVKAVRKADRAAAKADRRADRAAAKAARTASKADRKADRDAAKADRKADRDAAKADRKADRDAAKADRKADRDAAKADRKG